MPALDAVRLNLWSIYGTTTRFARELGIPQQELEQWLIAHQWDLPWPTTLKLQNTDLSGRDTLQIFDGKSENPVSFVNRAGEAPENTANQSATVSCDKAGIHVSFTVKKPAKTSSPKEVLPALSAAEQLFWNGDFVPLKQAIGRNRDLIKQWSLPRSPKIKSPLLNDCVIILISPLNIGKDRSWRFPERFVPNPDKWAQETSGPRSHRIELEGIFYAIAVNSNGDILKVFYDPWDGGTICPAWPAKIETSNAPGDGSQWKPEITIPWNSLMPNVNHNSIWSVDLAHLHRPGEDNTNARMLRSSKSTLIRYDFSAESLAPLPPTSASSTTLHTLTAPATAGDFPNQSQWASAPAVTSFTNNLSRKKVEDIKARITHDSKNLFVRFDCTEKDLSKLKIVSKIEEIAEYGKTSRRLNYLDRREQFGLDWGDYVEVNLAPNLDDSDRFHGGLYTFLVNSKGDLIERYSDSFGMFNVPPHPVQSSGAQTRVSQSGNTWTVELSVPLDNLCGSDKISSTWGLNLQRCKSSPITGSGEAHFAWSPISPPASMPGWKGSLRYLRNPLGLGTMQVAPDSISLSKNQSPPAPAIARSPRSKGTAALKRDRQSDRLNSIHFVDSKFGWAVGGLGTILHSSDGGITWQNQPSPSPFMLEKVFFTDRKHGWIVGGWPRDPNTSLYGGMGVILATTDGGNTWTPQLNEKASWLKDVYFINSKLGWAVGEYGVILKTTDGGQQWRQCKNTHTSNWLYGLTFIDEKRGFAVGHDETILFTSDGGENWKLRESPVPSRANYWPSAYRSVAFAADHQSGWIVGEGGAILQTRNGGKTWQNDSPEMSPQVVELLSFNDLSISPNGQVRATSPFALLSKKDSQSAWQIVKTGQPAVYRGIHFSDDQHGWISAERGTILTTNDGGASWSKQKQSSRKMGMLYATAHDHHINSGSFSITSDQFDSAYINPGRGVRSFELGGYYNRNMVAASAMTLGVPVVHSFTEYGWRVRNRPDGIAQRYQNYGGITGLERRLVAMIRTLRPPVLIAEQPVTQEDYYAHGVGEVARALIAAFDSAADPEKFPELKQLGLTPYAPKKLYIASNWITQAYRIHPSTLSLPPPNSKQFSERLGMTYGEAKAVSRNCFWGLLDRSKPPVTSLNTGTWNLHLKKWRGNLKTPDEDIFEMPR